MEVIEEPEIFQECFLYIYPERVYVDGGLSGDIALSVDAPSTSGFAIQAPPKPEITCKESPVLLAGLPGQKIGTMVITEPVKGTIKDGQTLTLELPAGARWVELGESSSNNLKIKRLPGKINTGRNSNSRAPPSPRPS